MESFIEMVTSNPIQWLWIPGIGDKIYDIVDKCIGVVTCLRDDSFYVSTNPETILKYGESVELSFVKFPKFKKPNYEGETDRRIYWLPRMDQMIEIIPESSISGMQRFLTDVFAEPGVINDFYASYDTLDEMLLCFINKYAKWTYRDETFDRTPLLWNGFCWIDPTKES